MVILRPADHDRHTASAEVVVVAVTYNSQNIIADFLSALPAALAGVDSARVVIVDNASSDATVAIVRHTAPWAVVIDAGGNLGYAAAINLALDQHEAGRGIYILNPDAVPSPGSVTKLMAAAERDIAVGLAVPRIVDADGRLKFSLRREPTLGRALGEALLGGRRAARFAPLGDLIRDPAHYVDGATADWATGAALYIRRDALDTVGRLDERFFLYSEETDYALRLQDHGFVLRYVAEAEVRHPGGDMSRSPWLWSLVAVNRTRLYRKRHGTVASATYWSVVVLNEAIRAVLGRRTHRAAVKALIRGHPAIEPGSGADVKPTQHAPRAPVAGSH